MRVQEFPEAVEKLSAFQTAALRVDKHQQRTDVSPQFVVLRDDIKHHSSTAQSYCKYIPYISTCSYFTVNFLFQIFTLLDWQYLLYLSLYFLFLYFVLSTFISAPI